MRLAGRCACGLLLELAAKDPESHWRCQGRKRCTLCGEAKLLTEFYRHPKHGGYFGRCKPCGRKVQADQRRQKYQTDPVWREAKNARNRDYDRRHKVERLDRVSAYYTANRERVLTALRRRRAA
jgi:hypothetical protein